MIYHIPSVIFYILLLHIADLKRLFHMSKFILHTSKEIRKILTENKLLDYRKKTSKISSE
jgi:hypothetical protein